MASALDHMECALGHMECALDQLQRKSSLLRMSSVALLITGDKGLSETLQKALSGLGPEVFEVGDAREGMHAAKAPAVKVIIADMRVAGALDVIRLLGRIRKGMDPASTVAVCADDMVSLAKEAGVDRVLQGIPGVEAFKDVLVKLLKP